MSKRYARLVVLLASLWVASAAHAEERIVLGLSQDEVAITADFDGSDLLVFGAIKREAPIPEGPPLEVVITIAGPRIPVTVWRKERRAGIWVNTEALELPLAPTFYAVATSAPLRHAVTRVEDLRYRISTPQVIRAVGHSIPETVPFADALIRLRTQDGRYQKLENAVAVDEQTLFRTRVALPSNVVTGIYTVRIFLTREGQVIDHFRTQIPVQKVGIERWLYETAHDRPTLYGLLSLAIAIAAGWLASAVFRRFNR